MKYPQSPVKSWLAGIALVALLVPGSVSADLPLTIPPSYVVWTVHDFSALWNTEAPSTALFEAEDLADLEAEMAALGHGTKRLAAFESWVENGTRRYSGLFRAGDGQRYLFTGMNAAGFEDQREAQYDLGRRLIDVEVQMIGADRVYSGLWAQVAVPGAEVVLDGLEAGDFHDAWAALKVDHHLVSFETWWEDDELRVYGVLRAGAEPAGTLLVLGNGWPTFDMGFLIRNTNDLKLVDIDFAPVPDGDNLFSGKWVPAGTPVPPRSWLGVHYIDSWLAPTSDLFAGGYEFSAVNLVVMEAQEPTAGPMNLLDLEINTDFLLVKNGSTPNQLKPLHDSGTPGPPKP